MGVYVTKADDPKLYEDINKEVLRVVRGAMHLSLSDSNEPEIKSYEGHCIRCNIEIQCNPDRPLCRGCYEVWRQYEDEDYKENFCHICGEESMVSLRYPICSPSCERQIWL